MAAAPNVAVTRQRAIRTGNGRTTAASTMTQKAASQAATSTAARIDGTSSIRPQERAAQRSEAGIVRDISGNQISDQVRIWQLEKFNKRRALITGCAGVTFAQIAQQ
jgi:hypothetical protein